MDSLTYLSHAEFIREVEHRATNDGFIDALVAYEFIKRFEAVLDSMDRVFKIYHGDDTLT